MINPMTQFPWTNLVPTLKFSNTEKAYYGKYTYRLMLYIRNATEIRTFKYGNSWRNAKMPLLDFVFNFTQSHNLKLRVEYNTVYIYSNESEVFSTLVEHFKNINSISAIKEFNFPESAEIKERLLNGEVIVKRVPEYFKYQIKIKGGGGSPENESIRKSIYEFVQAQGDDLFYKKSFVRNMTGRRWWYSPTTVYSKTDDIVIFLKLMAPDLVENIVEVMHKPVKKNTTKRETTK